MCIINILPVKLQCDRPASSCCCAVVLVAMMLLCRCTCCYDVVVPLYLLLCCCAVVIVCYVTDYVLHIAILMQKYFANIFYILDFLAVFISLIFEVINVLAMPVCTIKAIQFGCQLVQ